MQTRRGEAGGDEERDASGGHDGRSNCQNRVVTPAPSDLAQTNCRSSCGRVPFASPESHVYHGVSRTKTQQTSGFRETHVWTEYCEASRTVMYNHLLHSKSSDMLNYIIFSPAGIIHCLWRLQAPNKACCCLPPTPAPFHTLMNLICLQTNRKEIFAVQYLDVCGSRWGHTCIVRGNSAIMCYFEPADVHSFSFIMTCYVFIKTTPEPDVSLHNEDYCRWSGAQRLQLLGERALHNFNIPGNRTDTKVRFCKSHSIKKKKTSKYGFIFFFFLSSCAIHRARICIEYVWSEFEYFNPSDIF